MLQIRQFGPNREEVTGEWRKLHNAELHSCTVRQLLLGRSNQGVLHGWGMKNP